MLVATILAPLVLRGLQRRKVLDTPNERSSHAVATVRGGGLIIAGGAIAGAAVAGVTSSTPRLPEIATAACACGAIGLVDDVRDLPALPRLLAQAAVALALAVAMLRGEPAATFTIALGLCWVVGFVNGFNFMDGINGIASAAAVLAGIAYLVMGLHQRASVVAVGGAVIAGATLPFVPLNFPRARMFLGDVGSYFIGTWLAALVVAAIAAGFPPEAAVAPVAVLVFDVGVTVVRRVYRREPLHLAHRGHLYQRLTPIGAPHWPTTAGVTLLSAAIVGLGAVSLTGSSSARIAADLIAIALLGSYLAAPAVVGRRRTRPVAA